MRSAETELKTIYWRLYFILAPRKESTDLKISENVCFTAIQ